MAFRFHPVYVETVTAKSFRPSVVDERTSPFAPLSLKRTPREGVRVTVGTISIFSAKDY